MFSGRIGDWAGIITRLAREIQYNDHILNKFRSSRILLGSLQIYQNAKQIKRIAAQSSKQKLILKNNVHAKDKVVYIFLFNLHNS